MKHARAVCMIFIFCYHSLLYLNVSRGVLNKKAGQEKAVLRMTRKLRMKSLLALATISPISLSLWYGVIVLQ